MERYTLRGGSAGYDRLQVLARVYREGTLDLLRRAGVAPGDRCLDLGCGGGDVTRELATLAGPRGEAVGLDMDEVKLSLARARAAELGLRNVRFETANVNDWDEPAGYDVAYCRFLLHHLARPVDVMRRMWAALRPGGVLVVEDADFDGVFAEPDNDGLAFHRRMYPRVVAANGGDARFGRKLYRHFRDIGIDEPHLTLAQRADGDGEAKELPLLTLRSSAESIVAAGLAGPDEVNAAIADLTAFVATPGTVVSGPRVFQVWARRT